MARRSWLELGGSGCEVPTSRARKTCEPSHFDMKRIRGRIISKEAQVEERMKEPYTCDS